MEYSNLAGNLQGSIFPCHVLLRFFAQSVFERQVEGGGFMARIFHRTAQCPCIRIFPIIIRSDLPVHVSSIVPDSLMRSFCCVDRWFAPRLLPFLFICDSLYAPRMLFLLSVALFSFPGFSLQRRCFRNRRIVCSTVFACCRHAKRSLVTFVPLRIILFNRMFSGSGGYSSSLLC